jgi:hypothetical protein
MLQSICNISNDYPGLRERRGRNEKVAAASFAMVDLGTQAREAAEAREYVRARPGEEIFLIGATTKLGPCQVRSKTERPCPHQAVLEIWGVPFCEACAREQEAYFAIGKLTMEPQELASDPEFPRRIAEAGKH